MVAPELRVTWSVSAVVSGSLSVHTCSSRLCTLRSNCGPENMRISVVTESATDLPLLAEFIAYRGTPRDGSPAHLKEGWFGTSDGMRGGFAAGFRRGMREGQLGPESRAR